MLDDKVILFLFLDVILIFVALIYMGKLSTLLLKPCLLIDLQQSILDGNFIIMYQPIVSTTNGHKKNIYGLEALIRWNHPKIGLIMPDEFIPLVEKNNLMDRLTDILLQKTLNDLKNNDIFNLDKTQNISINIPPSYLLKSINIKKLVLYRDNLIKLNWQPCIEITEREKISEQVIISIHYLRKIGFKFSIDDFGSGCTALYLLQEVPFDHLKIDKRFIEKVKNDNDVNHIITTIIDLSKKLDIKPIVEGVENRQQVEYLKGNGCEIYQGYYFYKPLNIKTAINEIIKNK
ncbi:MAG: EAL domain-containing protein [Photobacterium frigidiphilum]|uniref:EAL domain-containing protein n=1 Tax=Photobacterium frigidiphilum TaxID=264736 RepID=UPI0030026A27